MLDAITGFLVATAPFIALLLWRERIDARGAAALIVRADVHARAVRALDGESLLAIDVEAPSVWRHGEIRLATPSGGEPLVADALHAMLERVPQNYDVVPVLHAPRWRHDLVAGRR